MATKAQIEANRRNWKRRKGLTPEGRTRLRKAALKNRPWQNATGPRTEEGKTRSSFNSWKHGQRSAQAVAQRKDFNSVLRELRDLGYI